MARKALQDASRPSPTPLPVDLNAALKAPRIVIERCRPSVDGGRYPARGVVGQQIDIEADVYADGHEQLDVELLMWGPQGDGCVRTPMQSLGNDRWRASFVAAHCGLHRYAIEASIDPWGNLRSALARKRAAGVAITMEIGEGIEQVAAASHRDDVDRHDRIELIATLARLRESSPQDAAAALLDETLGTLMRRIQQRDFTVRLAPALPLDIERRSAGFASWYELFPRSQAPAGERRHGTFDDVIARLPQIQAMGFDVLYLPPIHPIGVTNRKGRNNAPRAEAGDPGSPYAIGSSAGGHDAVHPELGGLEGFRRLRAAAASYDIELALDFAIQCSPDHPWLREHPEWFDWNADGSIRYAENPPKRYEDIVNVDFYASEGQTGLWTALRDIVEFWIGEGVRTFRVDNPHTKPLPFWTWLIADIRRRHPETIFLSEAFTRPAMMYRLAKIGFSQSYTYFTWRDSKRELTEYLTELTTQAPRDFFRPHFFVNTHDINPDFLQNAPRPAYVIRAALAATLSGLWGVYNGFELCEGRPDAKRKEYADSEKYEIRAWDWDRPGNIKHEIGLLNRIRKENAALHSHLGLTLLTAWNDNILFFEKASPGRENVLVIAICLDPASAQEADVEIPLWAWNLPDHASLSMEDLVSGGKFTWTGKWQRLRLEPTMPFAVWRVR
ncbi:MAG TPA: alpha-1,4-glucan--maltose-1-phosphate maltosyltransferase [Fontimonas sp.]